MKNTFLAVVLFLFSANFFFAAAQTSSTAQTLEDKAKGYRFTLPKDWNYEAANGGFILVNPTKTASIIVTPHAYNNFDSFAAAEINLQRDGFQSDGRIQDLGGGGKTFRAYKTAGDKMVIVDAFFVLSTVKGGLLLSTISNTKEAADSVFATTNQLIKTIKYTAPQVSPLAGQLKTAFGGKKLSFFYTGNGYSEQKIIWLCPSGAYISKTETSSASSLGSGATAGGDQGTWEIDTNGNAAFLVLNSQKINVGQRRLAITERTAANEIGLGGARYFVQTHNECR